MKRMLIFLCLITFFCSCTSNDDALALQPEPENFYALTVGNQWVYHNYRYNNTTEVYDATGVIDSVSIVGTQEMTGHTYFKFRTSTTGNEEHITFCNPNGERFEYLREENGVLLGENGVVKFIRNDYEPLLVASDAYFNYYNQLQEGVSNISVPAGTFECSNMHYYVTNEAGTPMAGFNTYLYANGIGLVYDTTSFVSQGYHTIERRLHSYVVQ